MNENLKDRRLQLVVLIWPAVLCALLAYELAAEYFLFGLGGPIWPVGPSIWVALADLARMAGAAWLAIGRWLLVPTAIVVLVHGRWRFGQWSSRALLILVMVPVLNLSWWGVPSVVNRYQREQLKGVMPIATRVSTEFERTGKLLPLHSGLRGGGNFRLLEDGTIWLHLPSHLCSAASLRWSGRPVEDSERCFWSSGGWIFHCN